MFSPGKAFVAGYHRPGMNIEPRHLRYFVTVAEEASFTAAARKVHAAQQVLSSQIRQLEDTLGVQLLELTSRALPSPPREARFSKVLAPRWPRSTGASPRPATSAPGQGFPPTSSPVGTQARLPGWGAQAGGNRHPAQEGRLVIQGQ